MNATRPTTGWAAGEVIVDPYEIPVHPDAPPGRYVIEIGMYDPVTGERLPAFDGDGNPLEQNRILLDVTPKRSPSR